VGPLVNMLGAPGYSRGLWAVLAGVLHKESLSSLRKGRVMGGGDLSALLPTPTNGFDHGKGKSNERSSSLELDSMILTGPFQLEIFYDS